MLKVNESIKCTGGITENSPYSDKFHADVNYSSIFTELIQAVGCLCEFYASDLYFELRDIEKCVNCLDTDVLFIGIRKNGVDGNDFISKRIDKNNINYSPNIYIKMYRLETKIEENCYIMELKRIFESDAIAELCK